MASVRAPYSYVPHEEAPVGDTMTGAELTAERERRAAAEAMALADAQDALRWVADNLSDLWD